MLTNLISVATGGALAIAGGIFAQMYQHWNTASAVKYAMLAEIAATLEIIEARKYIHFIEQLIENKAPGQPFPVTIPVGPRSLLVYEKNADKLGYLPADLARDVVRFYALIFSVIEDVKEPPPGQTPRERSVPEWEQTLKLAKEANALGRKITGTAEVPVRPGSAAVLTRR